MISVLVHKEAMFGDYFEVEVGDAAIFCVVQRNREGRWAIFPDEDYGLTPAEAREVADWCDAQEAARALSR